ncbi:hypothetical protein TNCV_556841 [Trichonephila clavipes]|uniref:Uncharacterized protein n=1 Tax=Trichonephila clavipes TaxID=2585209 RepID=A0A8X6RQX1_TRICX|nr:hypothetical protein TNCV_556841 [Trichonephila clavipes]
MNDGIFKVMGIEPVPGTLIIQELSEEVSGLITEDYLILPSTAHGNGERGNGLSGFAISTMNGEFPRSAREFDFATGGENSQGVPLQRFGLGRPTGPLGTGGSKFITRKSAAYPVPWVPAPSAQWINRHLS